MVNTLPQLPSSDPTTAAIERAFCRHVAERLNGKILRYSQRLEFLNAAQRLRINRFRANLIIAMVQHQSTPKLSLAQDKLDPQPPHPFQRILSLIGGMMLAETLTIAVIWLVCRF